MIETLDGIGDWGKRDRESESRKRETLDGIGNWGNRESEFEKAIGVVGSVHAYIKAYLRVFAHFHAYFLL